jgi:hypothetical protein
MTDIEKAKLELLAPEGRARKAKTRARRSACRMRLTPPQESREAPIT